MDTGHENIRVMPGEINVSTDTREILARASRYAEEQKFKDWLIVDVDAHHVETVSWSEITAYIDDPVIRHQAELYQAERVGNPPYDSWGTRPASAVRH